MNRAEQVKAAWHGQRGGVQKLAKEMDPLVSIVRMDSWERRATKYYFRDGSLLVASGRGIAHHLEAFFDE